MSKILHLYRLSDSKKDDFLKTKVPKYSFENAHKIVHLEKLQYCWKSPVTCICAMQILQEGQKGFNIWMPQLQFLY